MTVGMTMEIATPVCGLVRNDMGVEDTALTEYRKTTRGHCPRVVADFEDFLSTGEDKTGICICIPPIFTHVENRDIIYLKTF